LQWKNDQKLRSQRPGKFYKTGNKSAIRPSHSKRIKLNLSNLDQAESPEDMDLPGLRLHELTGNKKGIWSVVVNGNWRITFRFGGKEPKVVNYEDYH
jgi:proteic killer suppression protein